MSDAQRLVGGEIESQPVRDEDAAPSSRLSTRSDGRGQGVPHHTPNDWLWAFAAKLNVAITVISAVYFHSAALRAQASYFQTAPPGLGNKLESTAHGLSEYRSDGGAILLTCMLAVPSAYALSWAVLLMTANCARLILKFVFGIFVVLGVVVVYAVAKAGSMVGAAALAAMCAVIAEFLFLRRGRMVFTAANLKIAVLAVTSTPQIVTCALSAAAFRMVWLVVAGIASAGSVFASQTVLAPDGTTYRAVDCYSRARSSCECNGNVISDNSGCEQSSPNPFLVLFWLMSSTWTTAIIGNVVAATVAGSVATWWSSPESVGTAWVSFDRVLRSSLGSVSKASMIAGLFQLLKYAVDQPLQVESVIDLLLMFQRIAVSFIMESTVGVAFKYIMENMVIIIAMYRLSFSEGARRFWALFRKHGLTLLVNEVLLVVVLSCIVVLLAIVALPVALLVFMLSGQHHTVVLIISGTCALTIWTTLDVVTWAFRAVYICFLQEPEAFAESHDRWLYQGMYRAWREMGLPHSTITEEQGQIQV